MTQVTFCAIEKTSVLGWTVFSRAKLLPILVTSKTIPDSVHPSQILVTDSLSRQFNSAYTSQMGSTQTPELLGLHFPIGETAEPARLGNSQSERGGETDR